MGFIYLMVGLALIGAAFAVGLYAGTRRQQGNLALNNQEYHEYQRLLGMRRYVQTQAPEYITLGEAFARIILDESNRTYEKEIEQ